MRAFLLLMCLFWGARLLLRISRKPGVVRTSWTRGEIFVWLLVDLAFALWAAVLLIGYFETGAPRHVVLI